MSTEYVAGYSEMYRQTLKFPPAAVYRINGAVPDTRQLVS